MKKLFWGAMYVLAAVMVALTIYLYVVPEGEIILGDDKLEQTTEQRPVPVVKVGGVEVEVGETKLSALLDAGFRLMYEDSDGNFVPLQADVTADAAMQYSLVLVKDNGYVASIKYSNANAYNIPVPSCTVDALTFNTEAAGYGKGALERRVGMNLSVRCASSLLYSIICKDKGNSTVSGGITVMVFYPTFWKFSWIKR